MNIGLALSGGGALGAAHIGVLSQLENKNIKINSICGASAGAIIGLLYSWEGLYSINEFFSLVNERNIFGPTNILLSRSPDKLFSQLEDILREIIHTDSFDDLNIKYSCVGTDFLTGEADIFVSGDPVQCALASSAYPGVFPVQLVGDTYYIDGGVSLNMPVSPLREQGMDFIIASSIYALSKIDCRKTKGRRLQTVIRALEIMEYRINEYELNQADFVFNPPVDQYNWFNFPMIELIREIGESYASQHIDSLTVLLNESSTNSLA
ncbi:MAG TPA: patatin-like phospholipase family protein [Armatimonadota bacterium]|jgi:NTE family protein